MTIKKQSTLVFPIVGLDIGTISGSNSIDCSSELDEPAYRQAGKALPIAIGISSYYLTLSKKPGSSSGRMNIKFLTIIIPAR